ncbi:cobalamin biosynthesis protein CobW [Veronia nyctiphanis]|uniref:Cobalamin biosynthesis protein CobW n=1 Tax=Veronia nyctiphanis TaxID=1278244 RepID=A0A4Q0YRX5_9GAMM|nr:GTP-binding protein [Veronia nyctiphanis]RXJ73947.1 cobalamin biosynthesis protein CobW [Veronia nyctiphanis]
MSAQKNQIIAVPTNIITGFLGVGKTSAILHLMKHKPDSERWAVLVNEFGEIGVDGSLFEGQHGKEKGVFIREVPGGCMCCAAGLPMQIALNQLLSEARPDRLLVEPTGLGHPKEVLQVLSSENYRKALTLNKTVTLVDARKLSDSRYTEHETFNQQIAIADVVVGNKLDLYQEEDKSKLLDYVGKHGKIGTEVHFTQHGEMSLSHLFGEMTAEVYASHHHHHHGEQKPLASEQALPECGFLAATNEGEGFESVGWRFAPDMIFDRQKLCRLLTNISAERIKAVFITSDGVFGYNQTEDGLMEMELNDTAESRIEMIATSVDTGLESEILACLDA